MIVEQGLQATLSFVWPGSSPYLPAMQSMQLVDELLPSTALYVPAVHSVQLDSAFEPDSSANVPATAEAVAKKAIGRVPDLDPASLGRTGCRELVMGLRP